jgi:hypothetical protein
MTRTTRQVAQQAFKLASRSKVTEAKKKENNF